MNLETLLNEIGVSTDEKEITQKIKTYILELDLGVSIVLDEVGNLIVKKKCEEKDRYTLIIAHVDEVGLKITDVLSNGNMKFEMMGSLKNTNIYMQRIRVENNIGIVGSDKNIQDLKLRDEKSLFIDFGFSNLEEAKSKVRIGECGTFENNFFEDDKKIISKAIDNRVNVFLLIKLIENIEKFEKNLIFVFSVQEELGFKGSAKLHISEKIYKAICLDCVFVEFVDNLCLGKGPCIKIKDALTLCDLVEIKKLKEISKQKKIPVQIEETNSGATELAVLKNKSKKLVGISIPIKYGHTANGIVYKKDIELTYKLIYEYLEIKENS